MRVCDTKCCDTSMAVGPHFCASAASSSFASANCGLHTSSSESKCKVLYDKLHTSTLRISETTSDRSVPAANFFTSPKMALMSVSVTASRT
eukprot:668507-Amphidinium_carterae.1